MDYLYYCLACKNIIMSPKKCSYCKSDRIKRLKKGAPVNVTGTKLKGNIYKMKKDKVEIVYVDEFKNQSIKEVRPEEIRKIL